MKPSPARHVDSRVALRCEEGMSALLVENPDQKLREALSQIIGEEGSIQEQIPRIEALRSKHRHAISLIEKAEEPRYNCVQYAFALRDLPDSIRKAVDELESWRCERRLRRINPFDTTFVNFLIGRGALDELNCAESGDVIVYLKNKTVTHAGKMQGGLVHSKWGHLGHLWQHRVCEVPKGYGDTVRLFRHVDKNEIFQRLSAFIEDIRNTDTRRKQVQLLTSLRLPGHRGR